MKELQVKAEARYVELLCFAVVQTFSEVEEVRWCGQR
jgi:hypothetical protein